jgi:dihydrofolate reductase
VADKENGMGIVAAQFTMTLDGYVAGANDEVGRVLRWYASGDTEFAVAGGPMVFKVSEASAALLRATWGRIGAIVTGRRDFDVSNAWGGKPPFGVPTFIVTHRAPVEWDRPGTPFTFVTEGVQRAIQRAREAAGDRDVAVSGTQIVRQCLRAGLLDELQIDLVPMLLGAGIRLFEPVGMEPVDLEVMGVVEGTGVTHLRYRVVR